MRLLLMAAALAACTPAQEAKEEAAPVTNQAVPAPTPDDVVVRITAA
jgi:hypothetical protein